MQDIGLARSGNMKKITESATIRYIRRASDQRSVGLAVTSRSVSNITVISGEDKPLIQSDTFFVVLLRTRAAEKRIKEINNYRFDPDGGTAFYYKNKPLLDFLQEPATNLDRFLADPKQLEDLGKIIKVDSRIKLFELLTLSHNVPRETVERFLGKFLDKDLEQAETFDSFHGAKLFFGPEVKDRSSFMKALEKTFQLLNKHNLGELFGSSIRVIKTRTSIAGLYYPNSDEMVISSKTRPDDHLVKTLVHEYAHRYEDLFMTGPKKSDLILHFNRIKKSEDFNRSNYITSGKVGDLVDYIGSREDFKAMSDNGQFKIKEISHKKISVTGRDGKRALFGPPYSFLTNWKIGNEMFVVKRVEDDVWNVDQDGWFPTQYSKTNKSEYFAECFAFYILGELKGKTLDWFKQLLGVK